MKFYRSVSNIKAISFDLDDTLYDNYPVIVRAEKGLKDYISEKYPHAAKYDSQALASIKRDLINQDDRLASDMGELRRQTLRIILTKESYSSSELNEAVANCFNHFYNLRSQVDIKKTTHSCLSKLSQTLPLVAITNGNLDTTVTGLDEHFTFTLHASLAFPRKPYPDMFRETVRRLGIAPENILHVGDGLINDVYGGYVAGFKTAWLAVNRQMHMNREKATVLPDVQLDSLEDLLSLV